MSNCILVTVAAKDALQKDLGIRKCFFDKFDAPLRSYSLSFCLMVDDDHHKGPYSLARLPLGPVTPFPVRVE